MIRAPWGNKQYWDQRVKNRLNSINMAEEQLKLPSGAPNYRAEYVWGYTVDHPRQTLTQYSRGDAVRDLYNPFPKVLDAWELSNREADAICRREGVKTCRAWTFALSNLQYYQWCLWLVSLALLFEIDEGQWQRLLALVGGEGEDAVLDRLIATRSPGRTQGKKVLHKKPYARLLATMRAQPDRQAQSLRDFVEHWYAELQRPYDEDIWWYDYGNPEVNPLEKGSYFGRWCVEAVAVAKALRIDDSLCLGHEHYPGDFLRPNGPSTHPNPRAGKIRNVMKNLLAVIAFLVVWGVFPNQWLLGMGLDAAWAGAAKALTATLAAWWVVGFRREVTKKPDS